jgi:hypothetical protein
VSLFCHGVTVEEAPDRAVFERRASRRAQYVDQLNQRDVRLAVNRTRGESANCCTGAGAIRALKWYIQDSRNVLIKNEMTK